MTLVRFDKVSIAYGDKPLLEQADFSLSKGERVCLIGRNGAGKSTLMKLVQGNNSPDSGEIWRKPGLRIGQLEQELPEAEFQSVYDVVANGLEAVGELVAQYHRLAHNIEGEADLKRLEHLQHELEARDGWALAQKVDTVISRLHLPADRLMSELSGGWRRRVALGRALVGEPDLLLLDEPTNHLDITTIQWLEQQLLDFSGAVLFITHDRSFLQRLATRIFELDRGNLTFWEGGYASFLEHKQHQLEVEARQNAEFDKKLAQEEAWIRQGIKARRTRNEGRVRALQAMRQERVQRREVQGKASFTLDNAEQSGKLVIEAEHLQHGYEGRPLIRDFSLRIMRGDRIGLIGGNGVGKSTLLKLLLGELEPQQGHVRLGTKLDVAYFDQLREQLDPEQTVLDSVAGGRQTIRINGQDKHIISYLGDFLFTPERVRSPIKALSGGERNRLMLARLFSKPANLLVLDEPTNDLDVETLELLEEILLQFQGTVLLVSHDRTFIDNVVTSTLSFEGNGRIKEYVGGYQDWERQGGRLVDMDQQTGQQAYRNSAKPAKAKPQQSQPADKNNRKKLSYKLQRELDQLPARIETLEARQDELHEMTSAADFYQQSQEAIAPVLAELQQVEEDLEAAMERWVELEAMQEA